MKSSATYRNLFSNDCIESVNMGSQFGVVGNAPPQPSSGRTVVVNESLNKVHQSNIGGAVTEQTGKFLGEAAHLAVTTFNNTLAASFVHQTMVQGRKVVRPASPITGGVAKIKSMQKKVERSNISYNRKHAVIKKQLNIVDSKGLSHNPTNTASASPLAANMTTPSKIGEVAKKIRATSAPSSRYLLNNTFQASKPISKSSGSIIPISVSTWGDEESPENNDKIYNMRKLNGSSPPRSPKSPRSPKLEINMHQPVINNSFKAPPAANFDTNGNNHKSSRKTAKISATVEELEILLSALCDAECSEDEMEMALETLHDCLAEDGKL